MPRHDQRLPAAVVEIRAWKAAPQIVVGFGGLPQTAEVGFGPAGFGQLRSVLSRLGKASHCGNPPDRPGDRSHDEPGPRDEPGRLTSPVALTNPVAVTSPVPMTSPLPMTSKVALRAKVRFVNGIKLFKPSFDPA